MLGEIINRKNNINNKTCIHKCNKNIKIISSKLIHFAVVFDFIFLGFVANVLTGLDAVVAVTAAAVATDVLTLLFSF